MKRSNRKKNLPELVESGATNNECWIDLETIGTKGRILKELDKTGDISLHTDIGEIGHEMGNDLETGIFAQLKGLHHGLDGVTTIRVSCDILVNGLNSDLESCASIGEHLRDVWSETVIGSCFDRDTDAL